MSAKPETIGQRLARARARKGWSQGDLSRAAGVSGPMVSMLESGKNSSSTHLVSFARLLGVNADWLAYGKGPMTSPVIGQAAARAMLAALKAALRARGINETDQETGETFGDLIRAAIAKAEDN